MKNLIGAFIGVIIGSFLIVTLVPIAQPSYPAPYDIIWILLAGCHALQITGQQLITFENVQWFIITWLLIGVITSPFSDSQWSTIRTSFWIGIYITLFSLVSLLLLNPSFWLSETRNWELLIQFIISILTSFLSLISSIPSLALITRIRMKSEPPIPERIQTICECGAIFKSRPMICSECGKKLYDYEPD